MSTSRVSRPESLSNRGRVFAYCHDGVGIGHLARTLAICERVGEAYPFATFLLATGTPYITLFEPLPRLDYIKLPAIKKEGSRSYGSKYLSLSREQIIQCRSVLLRNTLEYFSPAVILIDKAPLGVCRELVPAIQWVRRYRPETRIIFGMRDIEDAPDVTINQWAGAGVPEMLEDYFDEIWVYGSRGLFDVVKEYRLSAKIAAKLRFMGYVSSGPCQHNGAATNREAGVLVTVGGGTDGQFLLETYLDNAAGCVSDMGFPSTIVGGPDLPRPVADRLRRSAAQIKGVEWVDFDPCLCCRIRNARLVVSMGGYNTLCKIARHRRPSLVVPRVYPRVEQALRAKLWSEHGIVHMADTSGLTPKTLAARVSDLLNGAAAMPDVRLDLGGLDRICSRFETIWHSEAQRATAVPM